jgi:hypothetical protein
MVKTLLVFLECHTMIEGINPPSKKVFTNSTIIAGGQLAVSR